MNASTIFLLALQCLAASSTATTAAMPQWPTLETGALPARTQFRRGANLEFKTQKTKVRTKMFAKGAIGGQSTPDGKWVFVANGGHGGRLIRSKGGKARKLAVGLIQGSEIAPDGSRIAIVTDEDELTIHEIPSGAVLARLKGIRPPIRFDGPESLLFRKACQLYRWTFDAEPTPVGPEVCGEARAGFEGITWIIVTPGQRRFGTSRTFKTVQVLDVPSEAVRLLVAGSDDDPVLAPQVVTSKRVCFVRRSEKNFFPLYCVSPGDRTASLVLHGNVEHPGWSDPTGRLMLFANGTRSQSRDIWLANFDKFTLHRLDRHDALYWRFIDDGARLVMWGGKHHSALLYDLDRGWRMSLYPKRAVPGGLIPLPGNARRFILGKQRGETRDLNLLILPGK